MSSCIISADLSSINLETLIKYIYEFTAPILVFFLVLINDSMSLIQGILNYFDQVSSKKQKEVSWKTLGYGHLLLLMLISTLTPLSIHMFL